MRCRKAQQLISARRDGELAPSREACLADHLARCRPCAAFVEDLDRVESTLQSFAAPAARSGFVDRLMARIESGQPADLRLRPWWEWASPAPLAAALVAFGCGVALALLADTNRSTVNSEGSADESTLEQEYGEVLAEVSLDTDLLALLTDAES